MSWLDMEYRDPHDTSTDQADSCLRQFWMGIMRGGAKTIVYKGLGNVFFIAGLLLLFGALIFDKELVLVSIFMLYIGFVVLYLQLYCRIHEASRIQESDDTQHCSEEMLPSHQGLKIDDPPQYDALSDLQPELFNDPLPSYEDVCGHSGPSNNSSCVVPIHLPKPVKDKDEDLTK